MAAKKASKQPEPVIEKTAAEDVAFQPDDLTFPEAPNLSDINGANKFQKQEDNTHPVAKQAILVGIAGLVIVIAAMTLALKAVESTTPLVSGATNLRVVDSQLSVVEGSVEISKDNGLTWNQAGVNEAVKSGDLLMTGSDGRAEVSSSSGIYLRINNSSQVQVRSLNSQQMSVELYGGTVFARNSEADQTNDVIKVTANATTYSARSAGFLTSVEGEGHSTRVYAGSATTIDTNSFIITAGMTSGNGSPPVDFTSLGPTSDPNFLAWNAEQDSQLELISDELGLLEDF